MTPDERERATAPPAAGDRHRPTLPHAPAPPRPALGDDCWILAGPTASGKTSLGIRLAERIGAEIVSVDSMAVYRGLDVGTAKPGEAERARVPHHLVDVADPGEAYSVARWLADVAAALERIRRRGRAVLFVGGTPLYLRALRDGLAPLPGAIPELRRRLAAEAEREGSPALHARLAAADPVAARRIHPHDLKRIVRALEVVEATGAPIPVAAAAPPHPAFARRMMILDVPRALLAARIDRRVERMFAGGLVEETRRALEGPGGIGPTAGQAAGYAEAIDLLAGRIGPEEAVRRTQARTRQLAKRQRTWLRSFPGAVWIAS
ncbi:MAG: tRNA (adenosine(37)-N6)-dimethylallyltransferase MiaA [Planctomycetaceae bacterium]